MSQGLEACNTLSRKHHLEPKYISRALTQEAIALLTAFHNTYNCFRIPISSSMAPNSRQYLPQASINLVTRHFIESQSTHVVPQIEQTAQSTSSLQYLVGQSLPAAISAGD